MEGICPDCKQPHRGNNTDCFLAALDRIIELEIALAETERKWREEKERADAYNKQINAAIAVYQGEMEH